MGFGMEGRGAGMKMGTIRVGVGTWGMEGILGVSQVVVVGRVGMGVGVVVGEDVESSFCRCSMSLGDGSAMVVCTC